MSRVIIAGSRTITDMGQVLQAIKDSGFVITEVVCGGARGADALGKQWADSHKIPVTMMPANWDQEGKSAGYKRNVRMGNYAEKAIVVWDGQSKGSGHMVNIMTGLKKPCFQRIVGQDPEYYPCTCCKKNLVWVKGGFDTCDDCLRGA